MDQQFTSPLTAGADHCNPPFYLLPGTTINNLNRNTKVYVVLMGREMGIHQDLYVFL
jgi:hypothetical protein